MAKLTHLQIQALKWLADKHAAWPDNDSGFNLMDQARYAAVCRRALAPLGLVRLNRLSDWHIRYSLTPAGRRALATPTQDPQL